MHERKSSSSLFLMELIIVLFFFLLTAAICIQVFARAHSISRSSLELSHAQSLCASAAEVFSGTDGSAEAFLEKFPEGITAEQGVELFYDENFQSSGENEAKYHLTVETNSSGTDSRSAVIRFLSGDAEIYSDCRNFHPASDFPLPLSSHLCGAFSSQRPGRPKLKPEDCRPDHGLL